MKAKNLVKIGIVACTAILLFGIQSFSLVESSNTLAGYNTVKPDMPFEPVNPNATAEVRELLKYMYSIKGEKILSGQHNYSSGPRASTDSVIAITGKTPAMWGGDLVGYFYPEKPRTCRQDIIDEAIKQHNNGSIITIMYHQVKPFDHDSLGFHKSVKGRVSDLEWQKIITPGTEYNNMLIEKLDTVAEYLKQLQEKKIPVLWRPYHEMNGMWFWYGDREGLDGYVNLWKIVYDRYVNHHKLDNLIWVWNPNAPRNKENDEAYDYKQYYPGNEYVDILATDIYGEYKQSHHDQLLELGKGKLIAIGECGKLPTPEKLALMNQFVWFMDWANMLWRSNKREDVKRLYHDERVITLDEHKVLYSNQN